MDLKVQKNALLLGNSILNHRVNTKTFVLFVSQKPEFNPDQTDNQPFAIAMPEEVGINSAYLSSFIKEISEDETTRLHTLTIIRNEKMICSLPFFPYRVSYWNYTFSMCKSITSLAIGMLIDENKLDLSDSLTKYFEKDMSALDRMHFKNVTIRHLLIMSSGASFNELGAVTVTDWLKGFLTTNMKFDAGEQFDYNSMNSYILSVIVKRASGLSLNDYLTAHLWQPLGINQVYWDKCPMNIEKGGWGLYLSPNDMAKIGQLYLNEGAWQGKQLVSANWIKESVKVQINTSEDHGDFDYGYHLWISRKGKTYLLNGMFGQNVIIIPGKQMVIVTTAGNSDNFQKNNYFHIVERYFGDQVMLPKTCQPNIDAYQQLDKVITQIKYKPVRTISISRKPSFFAKISQFFKKEPSRPILPVELQRIIGVTYLFENEECLGYGIIPLFMQSFLNNHTKGLKALQMKLINDKLHMLLSENDTEYDFSVPFTEADYQTITYHGDRYAVAVHSDCAYDEDGCFVLKITLNFLEYASIRLLKIRFRRDSLLFEMDETPGLSYFQNSLKLLTMGNREGKLLEMLTKRLDLDYLHYKVEITLKPKLTVKKTEPIMEEQN
ncbi:MAG: serine hydrolase [Erysipelotrichaceae bacterium]|nr:serine hydrolase [Erysipelotrichaceae bacterium]